MIKVMIKAMIKVMIKVIIMIKVMVTIKGRTKKVMIMIRGAGSRSQALDPPLIMTLLMTLIMMII